MTENTVAENPQKSKPDTDIAAAFWKAFSPNDPAMRLAFLDDNKHRKQKLTSYTVEGPLDFVWPHVVKNQAAGYGVYYHLNLMKPGEGSGHGGSATNDDAQAVRALAIDCDTGLPEEWHLPPDLVVYTSVVSGTEDAPVPIWKGQALWLVGDCPLNQYTTAQKRLIQRYGSDPSITDLRRVLRLPGSLHQKNPNKPYPVTFKRVYQGPPRALAEIMAALPEVSVSAVARTAPEGVKLDTDIASAWGVSEIRFDLKRHGRPVDGEQSDIRAFKLACQLKDEGVSQQRSLDLMHEHWAPHFDPNWLEDKIASAWNPNRKGANAPGCNTPLALYGDPNEIMAKLAAQGLYPNDEPLAAAELPASGRFMGRWPDEYENLPPLEFWDDDKLLPKSPEGCIAVLYGDFGSGKTNVTLTMLLDAVFGRKARVCYATGEGAYGVGKDRVPAHCKARKVATSTLRNRFRIVPAVPLFANSTDVEKFIEDQRDLAPNIVVIDTLATAIAGEDENSSKAAAFLTANGPAGRIRDAYKALVILPAHSGKDAGRGVRGHSGIGGNVDTILHLETDKKVGAMKLTVEKMRDGYDGFSVYFRYDLVGVPVPRRIGKEEYVELVGSKPGQPEHMEFVTWHNALAEHKATSFATGLTERAFAERLIGPDIVGGSPEEQAERETKVEKMRKRLQNVHNKKRYKGVLCDDQVPLGQEKMQWRWFITGRESQE